MIVVYSFGKMILEKSALKVFVRLNNRKKHFSKFDILSVGYCGVRYQSEVQKIPEMVTWCNDTLGRDNFIVTHYIAFNRNFGTYFYFENKNDALLFNLRWSELEVLQI